MINRQEIISKCIDEHIAFLRQIQRKVNNAKVNGMPYEMTGDNLDHQEIVELKRLMNIQKTWHECAYNLIKYRK